MINSVPHLTKSGPNRCGCVLALSMRFWYQIVAVTAVYMLFGVGKSVRLYKYGPSFVQDTTNLATVYSALVCWEVCTYGR